MIDESADVADEAVDVAAAVVVVVVAAAVAVDDVNYWLIGHS